MNFKYDGKSRPTNKKYDEGWDRIFGKKKEEPKCCTCKHLNDRAHCKTYCVEALDGWELDTEKRIKSRAHGRMIG